LLHELYQRGLKQPQVGTDLYAGDGILMFWSHVPIASWQDQAWLDDMRRSLRPVQYLRMIENRFTTTESSFIDLADWDACVDPDLRPVVKDRNLPIWVGIDASTKHDQTAIISVTWDENEKKVRLVWHAVFQPSPDDPISFEDDIERTVLDLRTRFHLVGILFDPHQMQATAQRLKRESVPIQEFAQTSANLTAASQNLFDLIQGRNLTTYPNAALRLSVSRAIAVESSRGWRLDKSKASHKIDSVVALAFACHAAVQQGQQGQGLCHEYAQHPERAATIIQQSYAQRGGGINSFCGVPKFDAWVVGEKAAALARRSRGY